MRSLLLMTLLAALLSAAEAKVLTIDDLIALAVENSPDLNVSRASVEAARQNVRIRRSDYLPQIGLTAMGGGAGVKNDTTNIQTDASGPLLTGSLTASQLVYDFGKTGGGIRAASYDANASMSALNQALSNKIYDVKSAYYSVLSAMSIITVNQENVTLNEQQLYRAERYFEAGIRTKIDVTDAHVNLIRAQLQLQDARYELQRTRISLERVVGVSLYHGDYTVAAAEHQRQVLMAAEFNATDIYATLPDVNQTLESLEAYAYAHRPELQQYGFTVQSAESSVTRARGDYFPAIALEGSYMRNVTDQALELYFPEQQWGAGIGLSWKLFEGLRTDANVQYAQAQLLRSRAALADAKLRVRQEVADAHTNTLKRRDSVKLSQSLSEAAREKFMQAQKRYEHGLSDYIELQQARQGYIDAATNLVLQYFDFYIALAQRDRTMGK